MKSFPVNCEINDDSAYVAIGFLEKKDKAAHVSRSECVSSVTGDVILDYDNQGRVVGVELIGFRYATNEQAA